MGGGDFIQLFGSDGKLKYLKEPMEEPIAQMAATAIADPTPKSVDVM